MTADDVSGGAGTVSGGSGGASPAHAAPTLARPALVGLALFGLLSLTDVVLTFVPVGSGDQGPPLPVIVLGFVLGVVGLALVGLLSRGRGGRPAWWSLIGTRVLSALTGLPAFVFGAPTWVQVLVAVFLVFTAAACVLVRPALSTRRARV